MTQSKSAKNPRKKSEVLEVVTSDVDVISSDVSDSIETSEVPVEISDVQSGISIKNGVAEVALDGEQRFKNKSRRPRVSNVESNVTPPKGRIIKEGEPVKIEADGLNLYYVRVRENTYQERFVFGSSRPSYFLLYRAGQKVPKSRLQNLG